LLALLVPKKPTFFFISEKNVSLIYGKTSFSIVPLKIAKNSLLLALLVPKKPTFFFHFRKVCLSLIWENFVFSCTAKISLLLALLVPKKPTFFFISQKYVSLIYGKTSFSIVPLKIAKNSLL
jgi:hypothetical protein